MSYSPPPAESIVTNEFRTVSLNTISVDEF